MADTLSVVIGGTETGSERPAETPTEPTKVVAPPALNPTNPPKTEGRPEWLPEKFKDPEQMAQAYAELEKMLGRGERPVEQPAPKPAETQATEKPADNKPAETPPVETIKETLTQQGLDFDAFNAEFAEKGELSPESYAKLAEKGYPKAVVDQHIDGMKARAEADTNALFEVGGGREEYGKMIEWAKGNLNPADIAAFNRSLTLGKDVAALAIKGLRADYLGAVGQEPTLIGGKTSTASDVFRSRAELTAAIKDPRYGKDPAYRSDVQAKAIRSNI